MKEDIRGVVSGVFCGEGAFFCGKVVSGDYAESFRIVGESNILLFLQTKGSLLDCFNKLLPCSEVRLE